MAFFCKSQNLLKIFELGGYFTYVKYVFCKLGKSEETERQTQVLDTGVVRKLNIKAIFHRKVNVKNVLYKISLECLAKSI